LGRRCCSRRTAQAQASRLTRAMTKKSKPEIKLGVTVRLRVHSGEIVEGRVVYLWEKKSVPMVRVAFLFGVLLGSVLKFNSVPVAWHP
jgi:hypothetical protein